jgi:hypothetical protein
MSSFRVTLVLSPLIIFYAFSRFTFFTSAEKPAYCFIFLSFISGLILLLEILFNPFLSICPVSLSTPAYPTICSFDAEPNHCTLSVNPPAIPALIVISALSPFSSFSFV